MFNKDSFFKQLSQLNITNKDLSASIGVSAGNISDWKSGRSKPNIDTMIKISDYYNIPIDYLLGRTSTFSDINSHNTISGDNNIIGNGNSVGEKLSEQEKALLDIFKKLNVIKQARLLAYAAELEREV